MTRRTLHTQIHELQHQLPQLARMIRRTLHTQVHELGEVPAMYNILWTQPYTHTYKCIYWVYGTYLSLIKFPQNIIIHPSLVIHVYVHVQGNWQQYTSGTYCNMYMYHRYSCQESVSSQRTIIYSQKFLLDRRFSSSPSFLCITDIFSGIKELEVANG